MNTTPDEKYSELLNQLLDGELEQSSEANVFSELANNDELRSEFRDILKLKDTIKHDNVAFATPLNTTTALFSSLGFSSVLTSDAGPSVVNTSANVATNAALRKVFVPLITSVASILITFLLLQNYYGSQIDELTKQNQSLISKSNNYPRTINNLIENNQNKENEKLAQNSFNEHNKSNTKQNSVFNKNITSKESEQLIVTKNDLTNPTVILTETTDIPKENLNKEVISAKPDILINESNSVVRNNSIFNNFPNTQTPLLPVFNDKYLEDNENESYFNHYCIMFRTLNSYSFPSTNIESQNHIFFTNMSIAGLISFSKHHKFGIEVGQESFPQVFDNEEDGYEYTIEQNPTLACVGFIYRTEFSGLDFLGGVEPFTQVFLGTTKYGPLGKFILGGQYITKNGLGGFIGLEGSALLYKNQQRNYSTKKIGLTVGLSYNF